MIISMKRNDKNSTFKIGEYTFKVRCFREAFLSGSKGAFVS